MQCTMSAKRTNNTLICLDFMHIHIIVLIPVYSFSSEQGCSMLTFNHSLFP